MVSTQNMHLKTGARQRKDVRGSVNSFSLPLCERSTKNFPKLLDDVSSKFDSLSHWTSRHCISQCAVQCATTTDAMFHERRLCERLVKTTQKTFSEPVVSKNILLTSTHKSVWSAALRLRTSTRGRGPVLPDFSIQRSSLSNIALTSQALGYYYVMFDVASQHHLWVSCNQIYALRHPSVRRRSRGYDACLGR